MARSESRWEVGWELGEGVRHGDEGAQVSFVMKECLQQQVDTGFAERGIELPMQAKAVKRTTNRFIKLN